MGFQEMVELDRAAVFLNPLEFGETHQVEGRDIVIVLDTDELKARQGSQDLAVADSGTLFYACAEDLPPRRAPGSNLNVDGRECVIDDWKEDMGMATITLRETITG